MKSLPVVLLAALTLFAHSVAAEMDGQYLSEAECKLTVTKLNLDSGYADAFYQLRSDGVGACEWSGIGVARRTHIEMGLVSGSLSSFADVNWVFGPAGDQVEITYFDPDGTLRNKEVFNRASDDSVAIN